MWKPSPRTSSLLVLSGILAIGSVACNNDESANVPSPSTATAPASPSAPPATARVKKTKAPKPSESTANQPPANSDAYDRAIDIATGATTISKSAVSRQDWSLVASQWQQAISLMKTVPTSSKQHINAQSKVTQYQRFLTEAKEKATPPAKKPQQGDTNPQFFSVPIKGRAGGTPIVEVTIDGTQTFEMLFDTGATGTLITLGMAKALRLKPVGVTKSVIADGSVVTLPVVILKSIEIDGRLKRKVPVSVAPPAMPIGLLGQNFYEGYDISIKEDIIEFRRR